MFQLDITFLEFDGAGTTTDSYTVAIILPSGSHQIYFSHVLRMMALTNFLPILGLGLSPILIALILVDLFPLCRKI